MTGVSWTLLLLAAAAALTDWVAVARRDTALEGYAKPAATGAFLLAAVVIDPIFSGQKWWFVLGLVLCLAGDVLLWMDRFVEGLGAFLGAHLAFVFGLSLRDLDEIAGFAGAVVGVVLVVDVGHRVISAARLSEPGLVGPVAAYVAAIATTVALAVATRSLAAVLGGLLFVASDFVIAQRRFLGERAWQGVTIMVTYHGALFFLVLSIAGRPVDVPFI